MVTSSNPRAPLGTALITGASAGIGATYAERLAARGYNLILVARDADRLHALGERLAERHDIRTEVLRADLSQRDDVKTVALRLQQEPAITLFVNNAGIGPKGRLLKAELDYLDQMVDLNVTAANRLAVAAAQAFAARGEGKIVNIASAVAIDPGSFNGTYSAGKAFILALTQALAVELEGTGVQIQAVLPGYTRTEIFDRVGASIDKLDPNTVMEVRDLVDAALAGLDQQELVTIPSLADVRLYDQLEIARNALRPNLSLSKPAARYGVEAKEAKRA